MSNKILIIDDEPDLLTDIGTILELKGYNVLLASDGTQGIETAFNEIPDLILCDIMMPKVDGYGVLKAVSDNPLTCEIPFLFISAKSTKEDIREGMNLGADDYITKPFDLDELLTAVDTRIKKAEASTDSINKKFEGIKEVMSKTLPHEFRTPLNSILGYSDYLIKQWKETDEETAVDMLNAINTDAKRLNRLFENYLFYTKISAMLQSKTDKKEARRSKTEIPEVVIGDVLMMATYDKDIELHTEFTNQDFSLSINKEHFTKIIFELIDNSIKFSDPDADFIKVQGRVKKDEYFLSYSNKGRDLLEKDLLDIDAFSQIERNKYEQQGTGMGLAIVKKTLELYEGGISVENSDSWTVITISIPIHS